MKPYNKAFFGALEGAFQILKRRYGTKATLKIMEELMERNLGAAYRAMKVKEKCAEVFKRVVGERDKAVGLRVSFHDLPNGFAYRFHTDPFPNLRGKVKHEALDATYLNFKMRSLLGKDWRYRTTKHLWKGHAYTEHVFERTKRRK
ncbi:MAG: hypothetical protein Q8R15_04460 [Candidatus Micrarchaeota archaeon]|nr:hypothetical protein [Candidatus Micrarchaeota archaeon]